MSVFFNGTNDTEDLIRLFLERMSYYGYALEDDDGQRLGGVVDFNRFEQVFWGRCNEKMDTLAVKMDEIKYGPGNEYSGVNYAVDAFTGFLRDWSSYFAAGATINLDEGDPYLGRISCFKSFSDTRDPRILYSNYTDSFSSSFAEYLRDRNLLHSIADLNDYVKHFIIFLRQGISPIPFTMTAWQKSTLSNMYTSGLVFSISNLDCGNDRDKSTFINSPNFSTFLYVARRHGFSISLMCPWMMVFTPLSDSGDTSTDTEPLYAKKYRFDNGLYEKTNCWNKTYDMTYVTDIEVLKNNLIKLYNRFVQTFPYRHERRISCGKTVKCNFQRQAIQPEDFDSIYSEINLYKLYIDLRNIEEGQPFPPPDIARMKEKAIFFYKNLDKQSSLSYINDQYRFSYTLKEGSLNQFLVKKEKQSEE